MIALVAAVLVAGGIVVVAAGVASRLASRQLALTRILDLERADPTQSPQALVALMERAGALADRAFRGSATTTKVQSALTGAGIKLRPGEFGVIAVLGGALVGLLTLLLAHILLITLGVFVLIPVLAYAWLLRKGRKRRLQLETQLPTVLQILAGSLDSGASMLHAMEIVAQEGKPPLTDEFSRVVAETQVGRPIIDALQGMADRCGSQDMDWTVEAIRIQYTSGGSLSETLRTLAEFMRARVEIRAEVRALSAEARLSGKVLTGLPLGVGGFLLFTKGDYMAPLYTTGLGKIMLGGAVFGMTMGTLWMRRIIKRVEV